MSINRSVLSAIVAAATLVGGTVAAMAAPAVATANVNIRSAPGGAVLDVLYKGEAVDVAACGGLWCLIEHPGPDGYVRSSYLMAVTPPAPPPKQVVVTPKLSLNGNFCVGGGGSSICISGM